jgi:hypothetical protein
MQWKLANTVAMKEIPIALTLTWALPLGKASLELVLMLVLALALVLALVLALALALTLALVSVLNQRRISMVLVLVLTLSMLVQVWLQRSIECVQVVENNFTGGLSNSSAVAHVRAHSTAILPAKKLTGNQDTSRNARSGSRNWPQTQQGWQAQPQLCCPLCAEQTMCQHRQ